MKKKILEHQKVAMKNKNGVKKMDIDGIEGDDEKMEKCLTEELEEVCRRRYGHGEVVFRRRMQ